jgi:hypothetical protein
MVRAKVGNASGQGYHGAKNWVAGSAQTDDFAPYTVSARNDAGSDRFLCKAEITAEFISGRGW